MSVQAITEALSLVQPIVDVQPAYNMLAVTKYSRDTLYPAEVRAFARFKIQEAIKSMRETADHLEKSLKDERK